MGNSTIYLLDKARAERAQAERECDRLRDSVASLSSALGLAETELENCDHNFRRMKQKRETSRGRARPAAGAVGTRLQLGHRPREHASRLLDLW